MPTPAADGWHLPGEWEHHSRCWMAWPSRPDTWAGEIEAAHLAAAELARTIAGFEPVTVVCNPEDVVEVSVACGAKVKVLPMAVGDGWLRDCGPGFVVDRQGGVAGVHWRFNAWGGLYPDYEADRRLGRLILDHLGMVCHEAPLVLEGGAILADGEGTLLATEQCLLNPNRNPGMNRAQIERLLMDYTGATKVIWLGEGCQGDQTGGHVDQIACFVRPGVVLALNTDDPGDANFKAFHDNLDRLTKARDAAGRSLEVIRVHQPGRRDCKGVRLALSYTNLCIANGGVVMPGFDDSWDTEAFKLVRRAFPDREVIQVPAFDIVRGGGGFHSLTLQQPAPAAG
ncbi:MAG: agmatine deiminase [Azospirillum sp.]|nr:agmatine deiminase [Azospirillum sp.]